jgi:hypothetical protein
LRIFRSKREEVAGGWRRLLNEELRNLYASPNIRVIKSRRMRRAGRVARMGEMRNACNILVGKSEGKRPLGRRRRSWENNIKRWMGGKMWTGFIWLRIGTIGGIL